MTSESAPASAKKRFTWAAVLKEGESTVKRDGTVEAEDNAEAMRLVNASLAETHPGVLWQVEIAS